MYLIIKFAKDLSKRFYEAFEKLLKNVQELIYGATTDCSAIDNVKEKMKDEIEASSWWASIKTTFFSVANATSSLLQLMAVKLSKLLAFLVDTLWWLLVRIGKLGYSLAMWIAKSPRTARALTFMAKEIVHWLCGRIAQAVYKENFHANLTDDARKFAEVKQENDAITSLQKGMFGSVLPTSVLSSVFSAMYSAEKITTSGIEFGKMATTAMNEVGQNAISGAVEGGIVKQAVSTGMNMVKASVTKGLETTPFGGFVAGPLGVVFDMVAESAGEAANSVILAQTMQNDILHTFNNIFEMLDVESCLMEMFGNEAQVVATWKKFRRILLLYKVQLYGTCKNTIQENHPELWVAITNKKNNGAREIDMNKLQETVLRFDKYNDMDVYANAGDIYREFPNDEQKSCRLLSDVFDTKNKQEQKIVDERIIKDEQTRNQTCRICCVII